MNKKVKAFTMIEVVVVVTLMAISSLVGILSVVQYYTTATVDSNARQLVAFLREARQKAISNDRSSDYSVYIEAKQYTGFYGSVYNSSDPENIVREVIDPISLSTTYTGSIITFNNYTGRLNVAGTITIQADPDLVERTIELTTPGLIRY